MLLEFFSGEISEQAQVQSWVQCHGVADVQPATPMVSNLQSSGDDVEAPICIGELFWGGRRYPSAFRAVCAQDMAICVVVPVTIASVVQALALNPINDVAILMTLTIALGNPGSGLQVDETTAFGIPGVVQVPGVLFDLAIWVFGLEDIFFTIAIQGMDCPDHVPWHVFAKGMVAAHVAHINGLIVR